LFLSHGFPHYNPPYAFPIPHSCYMHSPLMQSVYSGWAPCFRGGMTLCLALCLELRSVEWQFRKNPCARVKTYSFSTWNSWPLKMRPVGCPETSVPDITRLWT
jgi:hypothetical protein